MSTEQKLLHFSYVQTCTLQPFVFVLISCCFHRKCVAPSTPPPQCSTFRKQSNTGWRQGGWQLPVLAWSRDVASSCSPEARGCVGHGGRPLTFPDESDANLVLCPLDWNWLSASPCRHQGELLLTKLQQEQPSNLLWASPGWKKSSSGPR